MTIRRLFPDLALAWALALLIASAACDDGVSASRGAARAACVITSECGNGLECSSGVCVAPLPTASQYRACALDIDCPGGDHCDLGACTHTCVADRDCQAGHTCDLRGRCATPPTFNEPPAPTPPTPTAPLLHVDATQLAFATFDETKTITVENTGDAPLAFRIMTDRAWLDAEPVTGEVAAGGSADVTVFAQRAGNGTRGSVSIVSTGGAASVGVAVPSTLMGLYQGEVHLTSPSDLGHRTLAIALAQRSTGGLGGVVDDARSPAFGFRSALDASSAVSGDSVTIKFVVPGRTGTGGNPTYPADLLRTIVITGITTAGGGVAGDYVETIEGALSAPIVLSGTVELAQVDRAATPLPEQTDAVTLKRPAPPVFLACDFCPSGRCPTDHVEAGRQFLDAAFKFYKSPLAEGTGDAYAPLRTCIDDPGGCYDPIALHCAQAHFFQATKEGGARSCPGDCAQRGLLDTFKGLLVLNTVLGNERMVRAYGLGQPLEVQRNELVAARNAFSQGFLGAHVGGARVWGMLDPFFLEWLGTVPASAWAAHQSSSLPEQLRSRASDPDATTVAPFGDMARLAGSLDLWVQSLRDEVSARHRLEQGTPDSLMLSAGRAAAEIHVTLALAAALQMKMGAPDRLANAVEHVDQVSTKLQNIARGLNPAGYPDQFISYTYSAALGSTSNNYRELLREFHDGWLPNARTSYEAAEHLRRQFESDYVELTRQLTATNNDTGQRIVALCGGSASAPTIESCGGRGGLVFDTVQQIVNANLRLQNAKTAITNQHELIKIEEHRAAEQAHLHEVEAVAIGADGRKLEDLQDKETIIDAVAAAADGLCSGLASGNVAGFAAGAAAGGTAALTIALKGQIAKERIQIDTLAKARVEYNAAKELLIESAARVKQLMLEIPVLRIEAMIAALEVGRLAGQLHSQMQEARDALVSRKIMHLPAETDPRRDPAFRQYRDRMTVLANKAFDEAQGQLFLVTRALEFELGMSFGRRGDLFRLVTPTDLELYEGDLKLAYQHFISRVGNSQERETTLSLRDQIYRFSEALSDATTGGGYEPAELFRRLLAEPRNRDADGNVRLSFSLPLAQDGLIFNRGYCTDKITGIRISLVGASLGATQPEVMLAQRGSGYLRSCTETDAKGEPIVVEYNLENTIGARRSIVHAGLNLSGPTDLSSGGPVNTELYGRPISAPYELIIDMNAPANAKLDLTKLDDIVLFIRHDTRTVH